MKVSSNNEILMKAAKRLIDDNEVARWKVFGLIETFLARLADHFYFCKKLYVAYYRFHDEAYYKNGLQLIDREISIFLPDANSREIDFLRIDMVYSLHRFGASYKDYFMFDYFRLNAKGRSTFVTDKLRYSYCEVLNNRGNLIQFDNKYETYKKFKKFFKRRVLYLGRGDYDNFINFFNKSDSFIKKPVRGASGRGVEVISINNYDSFKSAFSSLISGGPCLLEEILVNHHDLAKIYPKALSTMRIATILNDNGLNIFHPVIRFGQGGGVVDNAGSGGIVASVDLATGIVKTIGRDKIGNEYVLHPDSKEVIVGLNIPMWEEAIKFVNELSLVVPDNRYTGWDITLTNKGWAMIEGNARGELFLQQFTDRVGRKEALDRVVFGLNAFE